MKKPEHKGSKYPIDPETALESARRRFSNNYFNSNASFVSTSTQGKKDIAHTGESRNTYSATINNTTSNGSKPTFHSRKKSSQDHTNMPLGKADIQNQIKKLTETMKAANQGMPTIKPPQNSFNTSSSQQDILNHLQKEPSHPQMIETTK